MWGIPRYKGWWSEKPKHAGITASFCCRIQVSFILICLSMSSLCFHSYLGPLTLFFFPPPPWCVSVFPIWHVQDLRLTSSLRPFIRCHLCLFALHLPFFPLPVFDFKSSLRRAIAHKRRGLSTVSAMLAHILIFQLNRNARSFGIILLGSSVCFRTALHFANRL